jgi:hypothetical protein
MQNKNIVKRGKQTQGVKNPKNNQRGAIIYRLPQGGRVVPDRLHTRLQYYKSLAMVFVGNTVAARFIPTGAFDIDPLLGGTFPPGFAELSTLYSSYRVRKSSIVVDVASAGVTPFRTIVIPLNADPGAAPSPAVIAAWDQNPYAVSALLSTTGSPSVRLNSTMTTEQIFGSTMVHTDDNFAATVSAVPVNNWFWCIGLFTAFVTVTGSPMVDVNIIIDIEFYDRKVNL